MLSYIFTHNSCVLDAVRLKAILLLPPEDAYSLFLLCRNVANVCAEHPGLVAATIFALTRYQMEYVSLEGWLRTWKLCVEAVEAEGWSVAVWAHSWCHVNTAMRGEYGEDYDMVVSKLTRRAIRTLVANVVPPSVQVAAILAIYGNSDQFTEEASCILLLSNGRFMLCWFRFNCILRSKQILEFDIADTLLEAIRFLREHTPDAWTGVPDEPWTVCHGSLQLNFQPTNEIAVFNHAFEWHVINLTRHQKVGSDGTVYSWRDLYRLDGGGCSCSECVVVSGGSFRINSLWNESRIYDPQADANGRLLVKLHEQQLQLQ